MYMYMYIYIYIYIYSFWLEVPSWLSTRLKPFLRGIAKQGDIQCLPTTHLGPAKLRVVTTTTSKA